MNPTYLYLGSALMKNSIDIFVNSLTLIRSTPKYELPKKYKNIDSYFEENDINFKLNTINKYIASHVDNQCYDDMIQLIRQINVILEIINKKQESNKKMKIKYFNHNFEKEIYDLDVLVKRLDNRFKLMLAVQ